MSRIVFLRHCVWLALALASAPALAADAALSLDQANTALRAALDAERAKAGEPASPLGQALLASLKFSDLLGCQSLDPAQTTCILKIEAPMRDAYRAFLFRLDGSDWQLVQQSDIAAPQPTLALAQALVREHLDGLGAREADPRRAAEYRDFARALEMTALASCDLDSDSGAVECHGEFRTPGAGKGSKPMRFQLRGTDWALLPD